MSPFLVTRFHLNQTSVIKLRLMKCLNPTQSHWCCVDEIIGLWPFAEFYSHAFKSHDLSLLLLFHAIDIAYRNTTVSTYKRHIYELNAEISWCAPEYSIMCKFLEVTDCCEQGMAVGCDGDGWLYDRLSVSSIINRYTLSQTEQDVASCGFPPSSRTCQLLPIDWIAKA